jgi:hypothetical protein
MSENAGNKRQGESLSEDAGAAPGSQDKDYEVGYRKPPKQSRFVKGQSGNPGGRPRKKKPQPVKLSDAPTDGYVEAEAYRLIELLENGEKIELPTLRAIVRAMAVSALKGNRLSQKYFLEYVERQEERHLQYKVQNYVRLEALKRDGERSIADAERRGLPPPELLPHPDDIRLNPATGEARITGPETVEDLRFYEHMAQERDYLLLCSAHYNPPGGKGAANPPDTYCSYLVFAQMLDLLLPRRMRWQDNHQLKLMMEYLHLPKRERERRIAAEGRRLDATRPKPIYITPEMDE